MCTGRDPRGDRLVPTQLAAMAAGVTEATIRKWASRGKIRRYGTPGRAYYDLDELLNTLSDRLYRAASTGLSPGIDGEET